MNEGARTERRREKNKQDEREVQFFVDLSFQCGFESGIRR
jgi:hypothetical protein